MTYRDCPIISESVYDFVRDEDMVAAIAFLTGESIEYTTTYWEMTKRVAIAHFIIPDSPYTLH